MDCLWYHARQHNGCCVWSINRHQALSRLASYAWQHRRPTPDCLCAGLLLSRISSVCSSIPHSYAFEFTTQLTSYPVGISNIKRSKRLSDHSSAYDTPTSKLPVIHTIPTLELRSSAKQIGAKTSSLSLSSFLPSQGTVAQHGPHGFSCLGKWQI